ncbi:YadA-like family protein [Acidaminococcus intestini]|uniref:YadA-like family protein n=1 Tax=Acidaminococcus intestini TaxID=187327 RepID=UPI0026DC4A7A|nr:YadA-like family protein [Acidaminococcus intestini]
MRGTMSLRKKIAILTMASMTVWGVTALLPFNQGGAVGNVGYAAEITPEKQVSMDYKTSGGTTAQTTGDLYYAFIDSTNSWWGHAGQIFVTDSGSIGTATAPLALYGQVLGGQYNTASGNYSVVLGGSGNTASGVYSVVTGGANNIASGRNSIVVSGSTNTASGENASIMGGNTNTASGTNSTIIGGSNNKNGAANGIIIGGNQHELTSGTDTVFVGGTVNKSSGNANQSVLIGGTKNTVGGRQAGIFGGTYNMTAGTLTSVYGGASNTVSGTGTAILGGWSNAASGLYSVLVGGEKGAAQGQYSVALGGASTADTAKDAVAIGIGASANVEKGVAIGAGAVATEAGTISVGHNKGDKYYQTSYTVNGGGTVKEQTYSSNLYNRLVNVGYGKDGHDAATMDQLTKVSAGDRISVASETDQTTGAATYKISVNNDGAVVSGDANLVAGGTVYSEVRPSSDGTYVKTASTTGDNLLALDGQVKSNADNISTNTSNIASNATDIRNLKDLSNITADGQTVIKKAAVGAITVKAGDRVEVQMEKATDGSSVTYTVSAKNDGKVAKDDANLVSGDTVYNAIEDAKNAIDTDMDTKVSNKANIDASNVGKNLKGDDGSTSASDDAIQQNLNAWGSAVGTGTIDKNNGQLVTGGTVYTEVRPKEDGTYVKMASTTGDNLLALDKQVGTNAKNITDLTNLTNITDAGKTVIKNLAKGTIDMENGSYTTVSSREVDGVKTFKVDVASDGKVEEGNSGLVTGDTVYDALNKASQDTNKNLDKKANIDASNIGSNLKNADGTAASEEDQKKNAESWGKAIGTGEVKESDNRLVTGDTVAKAIKDETRVSEDGTYVKKDATAGENLKNLDDQVKKNTDNITSIKNITDNLDNNYAKTDLSNVTDEGKTTIKNLAQDAVKVVNGKNTTVTTKTETNGNISYAVNVDDSAIKDVMKEDMDKKADRDAGNLTDSDVTSWQKKLGTGESQSGDHRLISGDTLYNALKEVDGNTLMKTDGVTINIDQTGTAKTIDVRGKDGVTRTITGIATDPSDPTSAANVDYVDHRVESLNSRMTHEVSRAGAGAAALAALHPLEWDPDSKFEFALGYGHYKAANAAALGLFYRPNEDVMYNLGGTLGNGDAMMSGGVTFRFGTKGRKPKASPLAMQQTIMDQNAKIEHQDEMLKIQANKIDSLEKELLDLKRLITQK